MADVFCWLCNRVEAAYAEKALRLDDGGWHEIDAGGCDMELDGKELGVSIADGKTQHVAFFPANYCPCCGRRL